MIDKMLFSLYPTHRAFPSLRANEVIVDAIKSCASHCFTGFSGKRSTSPAPTRLWGPNRETIKIELRTFHDT